MNPCRHISLTANSRYIRSTPTLQYEVVGEPRRLVKGESVDEFNNHSSYHLEEAADRKLGEKRGLPFSRHRDRLMYCQ